MRTKDPADKLTASSDAHPDTEQVTAAARMNSPPPNAQYNLAAADGLPARLTAYQRQKMFDRFVSDTRVLPGETILDVGVTSDRTYQASNYLEAWYPHKSMITAAGIDDASFLCSQYPGVRFVRANGLSLPFRDRSFDVVHASAVIEHVGSFIQQCAFLHECCRVARRTVFITTPNRWFPVEFHTLLPSGPLASKAHLSRAHARDRPRLLRQRRQSQLDDHIGAPPGRCAQ